MADAERMLVSVGEENLTGLEYDLSCQTGAYTAWRKADLLPYKVATDNVSGAIATVC